MKKYLLFLLAAWPVTLQAQNKEDSITLKSGKVVSGIMYKMEDGKIYLARNGDSVVYTAGEVQTMKFCSLAKNDKPCNDASVTGVSNTPPGRKGTSRSVSKNAGTYSSFNDNESPPYLNDKDAAEKGTVVFKCNMCGGRGSLCIQDLNSNSNSSSSSYTFTMEEEKHYFV